MRKSASILSTISPTSLSASACTYEGGVFAAIKLIVLSIINCLLRLIRSAASLNLPGLVEPKLLMLMSAAGFVK